MQIKGFCYTSKFLSGEAPASCDRLRVVNGEYLCLGPTVNMTVAELEPLVPTEPRTSNGDFDGIAGCRYIIMLCPFRQKHRVEGTRAEAIRFPDRSDVPDHHYVSDRGWCEPYVWNAADKRWW